MKESTQVLLGLGLGLAGGIAIAATHNPSLLSAADAIAPVGTLWVNAIRMTVIPLVSPLSSPAWHPHLTSRQSDDSAAERSPSSSACSQSPR